LFDWFVAAGNQLEAAGASSLALALPKMARLTALDLCSTPMLRFEW
jgi:hypothetical protein